MRRVLIASEYKPCAELNLPRIADDGGDLARAGDANRGPARDAEILNVEDVERLDAQLQHTRAVHRHVLEERDVDVAHRRRAEAVPREAAERADRNRERGRIEPHRRGLFRRYRIADEIRPRVADRRT